MVPLCCYCYFNCRNLFEIWKQGKCNISNTTYKLIECSSMVLEIRIQIPAGPLLLNSRQYLCEAKNTSLWSSNADRNPKWLGVALYVLINRYLRKISGGIPYQFEIAHWRWSTDRSHTDLFESSSLVLWIPWPNDVILAGSEIFKMDGDNQNIKIVAGPILCNSYVQLN